MAQCKYALLWFTRRKLIAPGYHAIQSTGTIFKLNQDIIGKYVLSMKTIPSRVSHVFQQTVTIKIIGRDIIKTNAVAKFHEDLTTNMTYRGLTRKTAAPPGDIIGTNNLTPFHEDWTLNLFTWIHYSHIMKTAPPPGRHVFQRTGTIFELS
ncbi:hypothetical protein DPMN_057186 [Dreissena polymorpha]|uniref:Uncharacterized protein n=1 Tax=Dreissena polymorpha TaxID=45954 RepID=A0A9D4CW09_DREPO|nr:hypothetical protein DPMN_057186 [Dreissena polymorpha]